jgi:hypothetical protein
MRIVTEFTLGVILFITFAGDVFAHCDSLTGPVVVDARAALESGKVEAVLKWVRPSDEAAIREAFAQTMAVRQEGNAARDLADRWFFETAVRLHRAMEQEPFVGLRPADWKPDPVIEMADNAIDAGDITDLERALLAETKKGLHERFERVRQAREHRNESVAAGRAFVSTYLDYLRYVEKLHGFFEGQSAEPVSSTQ